MKEVLIVEDEEIIRKGLKILLEQVIGGFTVEESSSGEEALSILRRKMPQLILTDIRMREMDGLTFIANVRQLTEDIPIIIISGHSDFEYVRTALRYNVSDYLLKPINRMELSELIAKLFKQDLQTAQESSKKMYKILQYVDENLSREITLKAISDYVFLHPQYIGQLFKSEMNMTFSEYVTEERLKKAKKLLKETRLKVYEVAQLSGYKSPKHFMATFKLEVGKTPKEYRENIE